MSLEKEVRQEIVTKIEQEEDFKEYYNTLSEEDKSKLKDDLIAEKELLRNFNAFNTIPTEVLEKHASRELMRILEARGYKKLFGAKAKIYMSGRPFVFKFENYYILYVVFPNKKTMTSYCNQLLEVPTDKGNVYVFAGGIESDVSEKTLAYTAHFFDRYKSRMGLEGSREDIIKTFLKDNFKTQSIPGTYENNTYYLHCDKGLGVGVYTQDVVLIKTFISDEMARKNQKDIRDFFKGSVKLLDELND